MASPASNVAPVVARQRPITGGPPRTSRDVSANTSLKNQRRAPMGDLYHALLEMSWGAFLAVVLCGYFAANLVFATIYTLLPDPISNASGFLDHFFFSVQTWATIGYGGMTPKTTAANFVVVFESITGIFGVALLTGLFFAKFSRPNARVLFANEAVIARRDGRPVLMFRCANERGNRIADASAQVTVLSRETTREGEQMRRVLDLKLVRDNTPLFILSWTIMHVIDEQSPLWGVTSPEQMEERGMRININLMGYDATVGQTVHVAHYYFPESVRFDHRYVDALTQDGRGGIVLDLAKFHDVEPIAQP